MIEKITITGIGPHKEDCAVFWWAKERLPVSVQQSLKEVS